MAIENRLWGNKNPFSTLIIKSNIINFINLKEFNQKRIKDDIDVILN